ncbi:cytochrome c [Marinobacter sp. 1_MG-2023]|uniref:c-type cytochrome n=1 Tax=Marinobacter sp. 1_MG-2023 TaxID=3062627 RepID=UPI0026E1ABA1|nr:c-type cytochrome [Marinobacter sp. 1_MG-2023]MDO6824426.1 c-type cytochrome [Marinobacter sp. 1_MG-2023]
MKSQVITAFTILTFSLTAAHAVEGDPVAGKQAVAVCQSCHQPDGSGMNIPGGESWPKLAGLNAGYLYKQLLDIKEGTRKSPTMNPFVDMLNEQQLKDVAVYYSQLPPNEGKGGEKATDEQLARGEKLATDGDWNRYIVPCSSCHGSDNQGAGDHFPGIAGQHAGYIADQLRAWKSGKRDNDPQHLMLAIAERLDDEDIVAVSAWLSRQPAKPAK